MATESKPCGCGCGLAFPFDPSVRGPKRLYALDCPTRYERELERKRRSQKAWFKRKRAAEPRYCACGCGRLLPRYVRYHPDCESRDGKKRRTHPTLSEQPKRCEECLDQSWRRDERRGCRGCKQPYAPERKAPPAALLSCPLGTVESTHG